MCGGRVLGVWWLVGLVEGLRDVGLVGCGSVE